MKRALLAATALLSSTIISTPTYAAVTLLDTVTPAAADATTLQAMQDQCDALAAAHGSNWTGTLDESSIVVDPTPVSGPTEVGSHSIADAIGDPVGAGTFTPAHVEILGDPYRNGGSVNMFGIQQSVGGHYSASEYDFEGEFETTFAYAFNCNMTETVTVPAEGEYVIAGDFGDSEDAIRGNCAAFTAQGDNDPLPDWWGDPYHGGSPDNPHCMFVGTAAHDEDQDRPDEAGTPINQTQTDTLLAHEDFGEGFDTDETLIIGQVVVCISPSKTGPKGAPGTWTAQNGYDGSKCTTDWYNSGATVGVPNLNDGSHNWVTVPVV